MRLSGSRTPTLLPSTGLAHSRLKKNLPGDDLAAPVPNPIFKWNLDIFNLPSRPAYKCNSLVIGLLSPAECGMHKDRVCISFTVVFPVSGLARGVLIRI